MIGSVLLLAVILGLHGCAFFQVADTAVNGTSSYSGLFGIVVYSADGERPFTSDPVLLRMAAVQLMLAPLQAFFVAALAWYVKASIDEAGKPPPKCVSLFTISMWFFFLVLGAYSALATIVTAPFRPYLVHYFHLIVALVVVSVCFMGLDQIVAFCRQLAKDKRDIAASPAREKARFWFDIMLKTSTFDKQKHDASFSFYERHTPADILLDTARLYSSLMKVLIFICFFAYLVASHDSMYHAEPSEHETDHVRLFFLLGIIASSALFFLGIEAPTIRAIVALALAGPFRLGELISISPTGSPTVIPTQCIVGFVENFTIHHVVIRDFGMKQVWIPWVTLSSMSVFNWARRSTKMARMLFAVAPASDPRQVQKLLEFIQEWIRTHPMVDRSKRGYDRACIKSFDPGFLFEVIFYPPPSGDRNALRSEFILTLGKAVQRLGITIIPMQSAFGAAADAAAVQVSTPSTAGDGGGASNLDDLLPARAAGDEPDAPRQKANE